MTENQTPVSPAVLADGEGAVFEHVDGMHQARYIEMFLAGIDAKTGGVVAACYNPMFGEGGIPASRDTAPQALVEGIDYAKLKADYGLLGASLNGPKIWTPDWAEAQVGTVRDFNGIEAPWVGQLDMKKAGAVGDVAPYEPMTIARDSRIGWNKGTTVMLLDDADGNTWIMKGFQLLREAACRLELPGHHARRGPHRDAGERRRHDHGRRVLQHLRQVRP
jgi:hypothetical protein